MRRATQPRVRAALLLALVGGCQPASPPQAVSREAPPVEPAKPDAAPGAPSFMGRTIAQTMGYQGAGWLTRDERDAEENTALLHKQLGLRSGQTACDLGAGNGYHTLKLARAVAPTGTAVAVDIQPEMLELLRERATKEGVDNVEFVLAEPGDPKLGDARCDLILLVDVYHEFADPAAMLDAMKAALRPQGQIALAEFRAEDPLVPIKPLHKMSKDQAILEFASADLALVRSYDELPWQHLLFFGRR